MLMAGLATFALLYNVQPLLPEFATEFGISATSASLAVSLTTGPMALALIPAGILSDRVGRRPLMITALVSSAVLTLVCAVATGWTGLLAARLMMGIALAGVPAIAMTYMAEEIDAESLGSAMGLYIAGNAIGGMSGRLIVGLITDHASWRWALGIVGMLGLGAALAFWRMAPPSRRFVARSDDLRAIAAGVGRLLSDRAMPWLYALSFLLMGGFISIYNYAGFRLSRPPFSLGQSAIGAIFLLYLAGSASSAWFGSLAGRIGRRKLLWTPISLIFVGALLTAAANLPLIILGIAVVTVGFFGGHSIASSWVGRRAGRDRALAAALYLSAYYLGASLLGPIGGIAWGRRGWLGVAGFVMLLSILALLVALRLATVPPLSVPELAAEPELPPG